MAHSIDLDAVPPMLKAMLVGKDREHSLEPLVREFDHSAAPLADQVLMRGLGRNRLVALEPLAEFMGPDQPALDQEVEGTVHRRQADVLTALLELASNGINGEVVFGEEHHLGHQIALAGDRLTVLAEMSPEMVD